MIRTAAALLLLGTACTVPSLEELPDCDTPFTANTVAGGTANANLGGVSACRAVRLVVAYSGFRPECVVVTVRNPDTGRTLSSTIGPKGPRTGGTLVVGVLPPESWGTSVEVEASAFEQSCEKFPVARDSGRATLTRGQVTPTRLQLSSKDEDQDGYVDVHKGGTDCQDSQAAIHPGSAELCNNVDDNCNLKSDGEELQLGQPCMQGQYCQGTRQCSANGMVVCETTAFMRAYVDSDGDGHGDEDSAGVSFCGPVPPLHVIGPRDDCDDTRAQVYSGAPEHCDGLDNDCDNQTDEGYSGLGTACVDPVTQCNGERRCNSDGSGVTCVLTQQAATWFPDEDGDGFGDSARGSTSCVQPPGFIAQGGDCDDGNPFTHEDAAELCDGLDNDCDQQVEAAAFCRVGRPTWAMQVVPDGNQLWHSVSTWTAGGVWAVGTNNRRALLMPNSASFQVSDSTATACGSSSTAWYSVWADPSDNGRAYIGAAGGRLAYQDTFAPNCTQTTTTPSGVAVRSLIGLRNGGPLEIYGASDSTAANEGETFLWNGASTVTFHPTNVLSSVFDVHGRTRNLVFAVGGPASTSAPRIYRFNPNTHLWEPPAMETHSSLRQLKAVWVVNDKIAFAVGNSGSVMRWNGTAWTRLAFPNNDDLTSVVAFGASSAYATSNNGRIYRYNGQAWTQIHEIWGAQFMDIAGTSPADLWVVGSGGRILHWPH